MAIQAALPALRETAEAGEDASIVNLSTASVTNSTVGESAYNARKGAVQALSNSLAREFGEEGYKVRVNTVNPGLIWTDMVVNVENSMGLQARSYTEYGYHSDHDVLEDTYNRNTSSSSLSNRHMTSAHSHHHHLVQSSHSKSSSSSRTVKVVQKSQKLQKKGFKHGFWNSRRNQY